MGFVRWLLLAAALGALGLAEGAPLWGQAGRDSTRDTTRAKPDTSERWGSIDPGKGFTVATTDQGTLAVSAYVMWRYLNQLPVVEFYDDHLGNRLQVKTRNDLQLHRILLSFLGWIYLPKLSYVVTVWTVNSTGQVAVIAVLSYDISNAFKLSGGITGLPGTRSLLGSHPYWLGTDRFLADEYFRPGFTGGVWAEGEIARGLYYKGMVGNTISQLGITANQLTRYLATGASVWWMPTTGEFGPRGAFGDYEDHQKLATRFGTSYTHSRENRFAQLNQLSPDNTQIRISDGTLLFQTGALAPNITVIDATYQLNAFDVGLKYRGAFLMTEIYMRRLNRFTADSLLPGRACLRQRVLRDGRIHGDSKATGAVCRDVEDQRPVQQRLGCCGRHQLVSREHAQHASQPVHRARGPLAGRKLLRLLLGRPDRDRHRPFDVHLLLTPLSDASPSALRRTSRSRSSSAAEHVIALVQFPGDGPADIVRGIGPLRTYRTADP